LKYELIIFDLDGTLVDTLPDIAASLNHTLAAEGYAPLAEELIQSLVGEGMRRLVEKALASQPGGPRRTDEASIQALVDGHNRYYDDHVCVFSKPYDGIVDLLAALKPDAKIAVLSNKPGRLVRPLLDALDLTRFVDVAIGDYDGFPIKPDPAAARSLLERFGIPATKVLMVGDGLPDVRLAHALGCVSAAATWGFSRRADLLAESPTYLLDHPADVLRIAGQGLPHC
jgi:phosphoglycolate phosphatase